MSEYEIDTVEVTEKIKQPPNKLFVATHSLSHILIGYETNKYENINNRLYHVHNITYYKMPTIFLLTGVPLLFLPFLDF